MTRTAAASTLKTGAAFPACIVASIPYMAPSIPRLIAMEVVESSLTTIGKRSRITMTRIEAVIDVTEEPARTVEPRTRSKKDSPDEPIGPIVAIGSATIWCIVKVPVWANWRQTDID
jgi:hypothetical protein